MINFLKIEDKNLLFENFSEDERITYRRFYKLYIYSSEVEKLSNEKELILDSLTEDYNKNDKVVDGFANVYI